MRPSNIARPSRFVSSSFSSQLQKLKKSKQRRLLMEMLEERRVMTDSAPDARGNGMALHSPISQNQISSVTIVTHGFQLSENDGDSMLPLARQLRNRIDYDNGAGGDAWLLDYDVTQEGGVAQFDPANTGRVGTAGFELNWYSQRYSACVRLGRCIQENSSGWGKAAGNALFSTLVGLGLVNPDAHTSQGRLHFIGHSFGTAVTSEAVRLLSSYDVPVDQVTYLDPHDFDQDSVPSMKINGCSTSAKLSSPRAMAMV